MKKKFFYIRAALFFLLTGCITRSFAQRYDCTFKEPLLKVDFGSANASLPFTHAVALPKYGRVPDYCPPDGFYTYTSNTSDCFNGDWFTLKEDHTPNDYEGKMMLVNASETGGVFFGSRINRLSGNATYEFAAWMMNVCRINGGCAPLPPFITITISTLSGKKVVEFDTGELSQTAQPSWRKYVGFFVCPSNETTLLLTMQDNTIGGCGNDFALDDITISECRKPVPPVLAVTPPPPPVKKTITAVPKVQAKKSTPPPAEKKLPNVKISERTARDSSLRIQPLPANKTPLKIQVPQILLTRANPLIKQIETSAGELRIDLYDNGEIDGDTVSIYDNNELMVSRAGLSQKPVTIITTVDASHPHHEFIMVANNLGSIPPNTSLMIIRVNGKRYEVFISSSEQKNAKVVIDLKQ